MATIRTFIAIELSPAVRGCLGEAQRALRRHVTSPLRWVDPDGAHLTLKFLGYIDDAKVEEIHGAMRQAAEGSRPFDIATGEVGAFPSMRRPRVLWIGLGGDLAPLMALQEALEAALEPLGFTREARAFSPHLTLGRVSDARGTRGAPIELPPVALDPRAQRVGEIVLIQSTLRPQGAIYRRLLAVSLGPADRLEVVR
jgi:2'-5' RNA ligase